MLFHSFQFSGTVSTDILRPVLLKSFKTLKGKAWTVKPQGKQVQPGKNKNFKSTHKETFISSLPTYLPTLWNYELLEDRFYAWFISVFTLLVLCLAHSLTDGLVCVFFEMMTSHPGTGLPSFCLSYLYIDHFSSLTHGNTE